MNSVKFTPPDQRTRIKLPQPAHYVTPVHQLSGGTVPYTMYSENGDRGDQYDHQRGARNSAVPRAIDITKY